MLHPDPGLVPRSSKALIYQLAKSESSRKLRIVQEEIGSSPALCKGLRKGGAAGQGKERERERERENLKKSFHFVFVQ